MYGCGVLCCARARYPQLMSQLATERPTPAFIIITCTTNALFLFFFFFFCSRCFSFVVLASIFWMRSRDLNRRCAMNRTVTKRTTYTATRIYTYTKETEV